MATAPWIIALWIVALFVLGLALVLVLLFGPRARTSGRLTFDADAFRAAMDLTGLDRYLATTEARVGDVRPGLQKQIVWNDPSAPGTRTDWVVVFVHGFSASPAELRPLPDNVAAALGANLFLTRLQGHGRPPQAMTEPTADDWMDDMAEALTIGGMLGERILLMANSTGATLATWAAVRNDMRALAEPVAACVFSSPNFGIRHVAGRILPLPGIPWVLRYLVGNLTPVRTDNPAYQAAWTTGFPATGLLPMAASVKAIAHAPLERIDWPALFIHAPGDQVVDPDRVRAAFQRWGGAPKQRLEVTDSADPLQHILTGDVVSPGTTQRLSAQVVDWVRTLPGNAANQG